MKKVEIEVLSYGPESLISSVTTTNGTEFLSNREFLTPTGNIIAGSCDGDVMKTNHAISGNWKGFKADGTGGVAPFTAMDFKAVPFTPYRNAVNRLVFPTYSASGVGFPTYSCFYQLVTGLTIGTTYKVEIDVYSMPTIPTLSQMGVMVGIIEESNPISLPQSIWYNGALHYEVGVKSSAQWGGWAGGLITLLPSNTALTTGVNTYTWTNTGGGATTQGIFSFGCYGGMANGSDNLVINSISLTDNTTTTTQHFGQDQSRAFYGKLDLTDSENFPLAMSFAVSDGKDIESIFGDYSKTFEVPATKNNQKMLGFIDNAVTSDLKNVTQKHPCRVIVDGVEMMNGKLKIIGSSQKKKVDFYECVLYGGNADWGGQLKDRRMCDVSFELGDGQATPSGQGEILYDYDEIVNTWSMNNTTSDIVYPLVSYGDFFPTGGDGRVNLVDGTENSQDWRAWTYVLNALTYIFKATGYSIESAFFGNTWFSKLIYNLSWQKNNADTLSQWYSLRYTGPAGNNNLANMIIGGCAYPTCGFTGSSGTTYDSDWYPSSSGVVFGEGVQLPQRVYDTFDQYSQDGYGGVADGKITIKADGHAVFKCKMTFAGWYSPANIWFNMKGHIRVQHYVDATGTTTTIAQNTPTYHCFGSGCGAGSTARWSETLETLSVPVAIDDKVWFETGGTGTCMNSCPPINNANSFAFIFLHRELPAGSSYGSVGDPEASYFEMDFNINEITVGEQVNLKDTSPCDVKQSDFVKGVAHMFNLQFYTNVQDKIVYIEPFDDFFTRADDTLDWTSKIDWSKSIKDKYEVGLKNEVLFTYKKDSNDEYLDYLSEKIMTLPNYFQYYEVLGTQFNEGMQKFENPLFSPAKEEWDKDVGGSGTKDGQRIPVMEKEVVAFGLGLSPGVYRPDKAVFSPHILLYDGYTRDGTANQNDHWWFYVDATGNHTNAWFPRATFVDVMQTSTVEKDRINLSYNDEVHDDGSILIGLYTNYWRGMIEQMKLSPRIRTVYLNLKITDILNINLSSLIYLEESWWRINKIVDYNPAKNETTKVQLIQWFDVGKYFPIATNSPMQDGSNQNARMSQGAGGGARSLPSRSILGVSRDGTVVQREGIVMYENSAGDIVPIVIEDSSGNFQNVVRTSNEGDLSSAGASANSYTDLDPSL